MLPETNPSAVVITDDSELESGFENSVVIEDTDVPQQSAQEKELAARYAELEEKYKAKESQADQTAVLASAFDRLGSRLEENAQQRQYQPYAPQAPQETEEEFDKRFEKELFDKPASQIKNMITRSVNPAINTLVETNIALAQEMALMKEADLATYNKHKKEFEAIANSLPMQERMKSSSYKRVLATIRGNHPEDDEARIEAEVQKRLAASGAASSPSPTSRQPPQANSFADRSSPSIPPTSQQGAASNQGIRISTRQKENIEREMRNIGVSMTHFNDYVTNLSEEGVLGNYK